MTPSLHPSQAANLLAEFRWRDMVYDATEGLAELLEKEPMTAYIGFDPTASSLHVGSLLPVLALARLQRLGHRPIVLVGGGTGLIGDPSGKSQERVLLTREEVDANVAGMRAQLERFLDFSGPRPARTVNNADWLGRIDLLTYLRDVGKYFTVNYLLQKESVKRRIGTENGISYTEFSYLLLQAYDYLQLYDRYDCTLQLGGSDQWGNITAGCDLIRKVRAGRAHGLVMPLVTTSGGTKFGKTEAGTVWLDSGRTSPFRFHQFWLNTDDRDAVTYLKFFTFLGREAIMELACETERNPAGRAAQRVLAQEVTQLVHGGEAVVRAERASAVLFAEEISTLGADEVLGVLEDVPSTDLDARRLMDDGIALVELLVDSTQAASRSEAMRLIRGGGVYVNNRRMTDERARLRPADAIEGRVFVLRKGARSMHLVRIVPSGVR